MTKEAISLGADVGGEDADVATKHHVLALRKLLAEECKGPYSETFEQFALVLRVDGSVQSWGKSGVEYVRLQKKAGYATADIFMPREIWSDSNESRLRHFLVDGVREAINAIIAKAEKGKVEIASEKLKSDLSRTIHLYLK